MQVIGIDWLGVDRRCCLPGQIHPSRYPFILPFLLSPRKHIVRVDKLSSVSNTPFVNKPLSPDPQTKLYSIHSDVPSGSALPFP